MFLGFNGFRWPVCYYASATAKAYDIFCTFWEVVDKLLEYDFHVDYALLDGASTNRAFVKLHFDLDLATLDYSVPNQFDPEQKVIFMQDVKHCVKKNRNGVESSKLEGDRIKSIRQLTLGGKVIVWNHWQGAFEFNQQSVLRIHRKLTKEHIEIAPTSKMRNHLAAEVLDNDMLRLMKLYQASLLDGSHLDATI
jgi:hypothetical protein